MRHNVRVLAFPASVAVVTALGCHGIDINDPLVRVCRDKPDTTTYQAASDSNITIRVIRPAETPERDHCRKAA